MIDAEMMREKPEEGGNENGVGLAVGWLECLWCQMAKHSPLVICQDSTILLGALEACQRIYM